MSIRLRLTLWYTAVLAATLLAFSGIAYTLMGYNLTMGIDNKLEEYATKVVQGSRVSVTPFLTPAINFPRVSFQSPDIYMQYVLTDGSISLRSPSLIAIAAQLPVLPDVNAPAGQQNTRRDTIWVEGRHLRMLTVPLIAADGKTFLGWLEAGTGFEPVDSALEQMRWVLGLGVLAALALAAALGWWLARTAMRPIDQLTRAAARVAESADLSQRVEISGPQDEVGRLAHMFNEMLTQLEHAYQRLEEVVAAQRQFVADASHELRTPLTILRGNLDVLHRMGDAEPELRAEALADMMGEAQHMSRLVEDLLAMARADSGQGLQLELQPIRPLVAEALRRAENLPRENIDLWAHDLAPLDGIEVRADRDAIVRCLLILLDNAFKYTPAGGRVTVAGEADRQQVLIHVADSGIGIAPADLARIFDRFYRADPARSTKGTGLGLSIAKWIAREHGGDLLAASEVGKGSSFTLRLPRVDV